PISGAHEGEEHRNSRCFPTSAIVDVECGTHAQRASCSTLEEVLRRTSSMYCIARSGCRNQSISSVGSLKELANRSAVSWCCSASRYRSHTWGGPVSNTLLHAVTCRACHQ